MTTLIGVDPGARNTGLIAVDQTTGNVTAQTVLNEGPLLPVGADYLQSIGAALDAMIDAADGDHVLRVESIVRPNWHVAKASGGGSASNPEALIGTSQVLGAIMGWYPACELVAPRRNGSDPLGSYPPALVSDGERRRAGWQLRVGTGQLRHQRSAWDIAHGGRASLAGSAVMA